MKEELGSVAEAVRTLVNLSWAEVAQRDRKRRKNLLDVEDSDQDKRAKDMKDEVSQALNVNQMTNT